MSATRLSSFVALLVALSAGRVGAETIYFKNRRTIDALKYEIKKSLVYITMTNGKVVYVRGDLVDWEGTERLKSAEVVLKKEAYDEPMQAADEALAEQEAGAETVINASDLKRAGLGLKKRRVSPQLSVEVNANNGCWVDTRINVRAGQVVILQANGEVNLGKAGMSRPAGLGSAAGGETAPALPLGALIARIGLAGEPTLIGSGIKLTPRSTGRLYLCVNTPTPQEATGVFTVGVSQPRPKGSTAAGNMTTVEGSAGSTASSGAAGDAGAPGSASPPPSGSRRPVTGIGAIDRARAAQGGSAAGIDQ